MILLLIYYIIGCLLIAAMASYKGESPWWAFFGSLILTPLFLFIVLLFVKRKAKKCAFCKAPMNNVEAFCQVCDKDDTGQSKDDYLRGLKKNNEDQLFPC